MSGMMDQNSLYKLSVFCRSVFAFASSNPTGRQLIVHSPANMDNSSSNRSFFLSAEELQVGSMVFAEYYCVRKVICLLYESYFNVKL